ncbi:MAG: hypothetical protein EXR82_09380 [Gammaproteobacteria bacterium]|nr:hypothetical protein [Gammaproteobacteria bacterium]
MSLIGSVLGHQAALKEVLYKYNLQGSWKVHYTGEFESPQVIAKVLRLSWKSLADSRVTKSHPIYAVSGQAARAVIKKSRVAVAEAQLTLTQEPARLLNEIKKLKATVKTLDGKYKKATNVLERKLERARVVLAKREGDLVERAEKTARGHEQRLEALASAIIESRADLQSIRDSLKTARAKHYALTRDEAKLESRVNRLWEQLAENADRLTNEVLDDPDGADDENEADLAVENLPYDSNGNSFTEEDDIEDE